MIWCSRVYPRLQEATAPLRPQSLRLTVTLTTLAGSAAPRPVRQVPLAYMPAQAPGLRRRGPGGRAVLRLGHPAQEPRPEVPTEPKKDGNALVRSMFHN